LLASHEGITSFSLDLEVYPFTLFMTRHLLFHDKIRHCYEVIDNDRSP
jgi:hypothetical protein